MSFLYKNTNDDVFDDFPKISEDSLKVVRGAEKRFRTFSENFRRFLKITEDVRGRTDDVSIKQQHI